MVLSAPCRHESSQKNLFLGINEVVCVIFQTNVGACVSLGKQAADLQSALDDDDLVATIFAPTNQAFTNFLAELNIMLDLLASEDAMPVLIRVRIPVPLPLISLQICLLCIPCISMPALSCRSSNTTSFRKWRPRPTF